MDDNTCTCIGLIKKITEKDVTIQWNTAGVGTYVLSMIPTDILPEHIGWVIHATFTGQCMFEFESAWVEEPYKSDEQIIAEDIEKHKIYNSWDNVPDADWPTLNDKIQQLMSIVDKLYVQDIEDGYWKCRWCGQKTHENNTISSLPHIPGCPVKDAADVINNPYRAEEANGRIKKELTGFDEIDRENGLI